MTEIKGLGYVRVLATDIDRWREVGFEVLGLDAVGRAYDQVMARDCPVSSTLGRHTNDKMVSFYGRVPGGWDIEYGTGGVPVDETSYTAEEITADSYWGHEWMWARQLKQAQQAEAQQASVAV